MQTPQERRKVTLHMAFQYVDQSVLWGGRGRVKWGHGYNHRHFVSVLKGLRALIQEPEAKLTQT